jgi:hypothetical protein
MYLSLFINIGNSNDLLGPGFARESGAKGLQQPFVAANTDWALGSAFAVDRFDGAVQFLGH